MKSDGLSKVEVKRRLFKASEMRADRIRLKSEDARKNEGAKNWANRVQTRYERYSERPEDRHHGCGRARNAQRLCAGVRQLARGHGRNGEKTAIRLRHKPTVPEKPEW